METKANVPELLSHIKTIVHSTKGAQNKCWNLSYSICKVVTIKQGKCESLTAHCNRFMDAVEVAESQWGLLFPAQMLITVDDTGAATETCDLTERINERNECLACAFLAGASNKSLERSLLI